MMHAADGVDQSFIQYRISGLYVQWVKGWSGPGLKVHASPPGIMLLSQDYS